MPRFFQSWRSGSAKGTFALLFAFLTFYSISAKAERCHRHYRQLSLPPLIQQQKDHTCGAACVVSLVKQMRGKTLTEVQVAAMIGTNRSIGTTPEKMVKGLKLLGLNALAKKEMRLRDLELNFQRGKGQILLVQSGDDAHWVVLAGYKDGQIKVMDPWRENETYLDYTEEEFLALWTTSLMGKKVKQMALVVD